jgi:AbrB family looped-hinge helix DNA binding protein
LETVKISSKFQIVIPKKVREALNLRPGHHLQIDVIDATIHMIRHRSIKDLRGMAKGLKWRGDERDRNDRY